MYRRPARPSTEPQQRIILYSHAPPQAASVRCHGVAPEAAGAAAAADAVSALPPGATLPPASPAAAAAAPPAAAAASAAPSPLQRDARQLSALLLQLARLEVRPHNQWLEEVLSVVRSQAPALGADELCACMRALASWGYMPDGPLLDAVEARCLDAVRGGAFTTRQLSELAWTYAQLGLRQRCGGGFGRHRATAAAAAAAGVASVPSAARRPDRSPPTAPSAAGRHRPPAAAAVEGCPARRPHLPRGATHLTSPPARCSR
jgi:hypothetical protein